MKRYVILDIGYSRNIYYFIDTIGCICSLAHEGNINPEIFNLAQSLGTKSLVGKFLLPNNPNNLFYKIIAEFDEISTEQTHPELFI